MIVIALAYGASKLTDNLAYETKNKVDLDALKLEILSLDKINTLPERAYEILENEDLTNRLLTSCEHNDSQKSLVEIYKWLKDYKVKFQE